MGKGKDTLAGHSGTIRNISLCTGPAQTAYCAGDHQGGGTARGKGRRQRSRRHYGSQEKALDLLGKMETAGDFRGAIVAAKEARECLLAANELVARAGGSAEIVVTVRHIGAQDVSNS